ncbi:hypothetical protein KIW84_020286 [Lathyrus oleraceus]|uniref:Tubulin-specific chaperone A n=1 Tax=Pisum sativum TaxID=3888 RepID=A0A9D4Y4N1_PEA|nr:hypothetical protein KIW84_020286 [Pisum sativum]
MKKIGQVAYKLKLPPTSKIHPTFHVSQLKKAEGNYTTTTTTQLPISLESEKGDITPAKVLSWRDKFDGGQHKREWLIQWEGMDVGDATWEEELLLKSQFPDLRLEDKANVVGGDDDRNESDPTSDDGDVLVNKDNFGPKQWRENVLAESRMMVPDSRKRLEAALEDLKGTLAELLEEREEKEGPEIDDARNTIAEIENVFEKP